MLDKTKLYPAQLVCRTPPKNLLESDRKLFEREFEKNLPEVHILHLKSVDVFKDYIFQKQRGKFYFDYTHAQKPSRKDAWKNMVMLLNQAKDIEKAAWIITPDCLGYFHWLCDALPRLWALKPYMEHHQILLHESYKECPYAMHSLEILGYEPVFFEYRSRVFVKEMLLPTMIAPRGNYRQEIMQELQSFFVKNDAPPTRKMYVSRRKATKRKIMNEMEVWDLMTSYGVECLCLEDYTFQEQVAMMSETRVLIGLHGAGLANMLFMPPAGKVLELRNAGDKQNNCFFSLASDLCHDYYYLCNQGDSPDTHAVNIIVDIDQLEEILKDL
jgi:capsular polysaccharide biosynthesis protein